MEVYPRGSLIYNRYQVRQPPDFKRGTLVGGMGFVYLCHDTEADRPVALKFFRPEVLRDRLARDRFLHEGQTWVDLGSHPHIVRCYDMKVKDPNTFLVLELIVKEKVRKDASLRAWMSGSMPLEQALPFALQIARGLRYAAERIPGFVHRDLKPENVLVSAEKLPGTGINRLCVTDFGLIKIVAGDVEGTLREAGASTPGPIQFTSGRGTWAYMSPEQWQGETVGAYTDIYALGCILYEMLSGQSAAEGTSAKQLQAAHCSGNLNQLPQDWPELLRAFLERSLAVNSGERYQGWDEVTRALEDLMVALGLAPVPDVTIPGNENEATLREKASADNVTGIDYAHMGNALKAIEYFEKALELFQRIHDREGEGAVQGNLGNAFAQIGEMEKALSYTRQDLVIARERQDRTREGVALGSLAGMYRNLGDLSQALASDQQRLEIVRETGDRRGEGNALTSLGLSYLAQGNAHSALESFEQALQIFRAIGDRRGESNVLGGLGNACFQLRDLDNAIKYYNQYEKTAREIGDRAAEGKALGNQGNVYLIRGEVQNAIDLFFKPSLEIARDIHDRRAESNALGSLGIAYSRLGKPETALEYYEQRLELAQKLGDIDGVCATLYNMGNLHLDNGQAEQAASTWTDLYVFASQLNLTQVQQKLARLGPKIGLPEELAGWEGLAKRQPAGRTWNLENFRR